MSGVTGLANAMNEDWHIIVTASGRPLTGAGGSPILFPDKDAAAPYATKPTDRIEPWAGGFRPVPSAAHFDG